MTGPVSLAFRNLLRSRVRALSLLALAASGVCALVLVAGEYEFLFAGAGKSVVESDGDILLERKGEGDGGLRWDGYLEAKGRLLDSGLVREVRAESRVDGIVGSVDRTVPCAGVAVEDGVTVAGETVPAALGSAIAKTLGAAKGSLVGGLIADCGMTLEVTEVVATEASLRDRFYARIPMDALVGLGENPTVDSVRIWLADGVSSPGLDRESGSRGYDGTVRLLSSIEGLSGYEIRSMLAGNTEINKIVGVYRTNYRVVACTVVITMFLAFLNVLSLTVHEREREIGTLRAMGTTTRQVRAMFVSEAAIAALLAWAIGTALALVAAAAIDGLGGITLPPPPTATEEIRIGMAITARKVVEALVFTVLSALASAAICTVRLGNADIVKQLEIRD